MAKNDLHLFTWADTRVSIHVTLLMLPAFFVFPAVVAGDYGNAVNSAWIMFAAFSSILLHEFGHIFAARALGGKTGDIILTVIGGAAMIQSGFARGRDEIMVALAGPAVNLAIIGVFGPAYFAMQHFGVDDSMMFGIVKDIFLLNVIIGGFNLIPLFPMDGGRVLRGAMSEMMSLHTATRAAVLFGCVFGAGVAVFGILTGLYNLIIIAVVMPIAGLMELKQLKNPPVTETVV